MKRLILTLLLVAGTANARTGSTYHFTGTSFEEGTVPGVVSIVTNDGLLPGAVSEEIPGRQAKLPDNSGGLAILCYMQRSGGKMNDKAGYEPIAGSPIEIIGNRLKLMGRTNESGYLFMALPAGQYEVKYSVFSKKIRIEKGKTTLTAIRGGKRMVD